MARFARRGLTAAVVAIAAAATGTAASGTAYVVTRDDPPHRAAAAAPPSPTPAPSVATVVPASEKPSALGPVVPPDFLVISARPVSPSRLDRVAKLKHVHDLITVDAGAVLLQGGKANMFAVDPVRFRAWTPPGTATDDALWTALGDGRFVVSADVRSRLGLRDGMQY